MGFSRQAVPEVPDEWGQHSAAARTGRHNPDRRELLQQESNAEVMVGERSF